LAIGVSKTGVGACYLSWSVLLTRASGVPS
jgi:hypothetical protein